jgi:ligand-binding sensor domain-containing protein
MTAIISVILSSCNFVNPIDIMFKKILPPFSIFFFLICSSQAQNAFTIYNTQNSPLPFDGVNCIAFDSTGVIWIGTEFGLASFDGTNWNVFNTQNSGLPDNAIRCLGVDRFNNKWIGTFFGGLAKYDGTNWTVYNTQNSDLPDDYIKALAFDTSGHKWIGTIIGLVEFDDVNWTVYDMSNSPYQLSDNIACIHIDSNNFFRIGTMNGGLIYIDNGNWQVFTIPNGSGIPDNTILEIALDQNGVEWLSTPANGLVAHPGGFTWLIYSPFTSSIPSASTSCLEISDYSGIIWIGTLDAGIVRKSGVNFTAYNPSNSVFPDYMATFIEKDLNGILWIGTTSGGLVRLDESLLLSTEEPKPSAHAFFNSFATDKIKITSTGKIIAPALFTIEGQRTATIFRTSGNVADADVSHLSNGFYLLTFADENGNLISGKIFKGF